MKNYKTLKILLILLVLVGIVFLLSTFILKVPSKPSKPDVPTEEKKVLKLGHEISDDFFEIESQTINLPRLDVNLTETELKSYETIEELKDLEQLIFSELNTSLDKRWKYYIHFYDEEKANGLINFIYYIGNEIQTTKTITIPIENNSVNSVSYVYLDNTVNESDLQKKLTNFKETTTQEKYNLSDGETFLEEKVIYMYNYKNDSLTYTYNLFFKDEMQLINNDIGCEYIIE